MTTKVGKLSYDPRNIIDRVFWYCLKGHLLNFETHFWQSKIFASGHEAARTESSRLVCHQTFKQEVVLTRKTGEHLNNILRCLGTNMNADFL